jgi:hypothetical protein
VTELGRHRYGDEQAKVEDLEEELLLLKQQLEEERAMRLAADEALELAKSAAKYAAPPRQASGTHAARFLPHACFEISLRHKSVTSFG